jgi:hypothetical protein
MDLTLSGMAEFYKVMKMFGLRYYYLVNGKIKQ